MKKKFNTLILLLLSLAVVSTAIAGEFDIVINNGRVMDPETKFDEVANVGIKDGRIAAITKNRIKGKETINAKLLMRGCVRVESELDLQWGICVKAFLHVRYLKFSGSEAFMVVI